MDAALKIRGLAKGYGKRFRRRIPVIADLGLEVPRGEVYGLLGRNGAGKSTTFRLLMGLARPDAGSIEIMGGKPGSRQALQRLGFCPENPQFPPNLRVIEVLRFHAALAGPRLLTPRNRIDWLMNQFELDTQRKKSVSALSRGTVQRLALAVSFLSRPELMILDEPLTGLDPLSRQRVLELLREQKQHGTAMIISSHILNDLEDVADRLGVLAGGRIRRELRLDEERDSRQREMAIRIPPEFAKEVRADVAEIVNVREGGDGKFGGIPFEQAQVLVKSWTAAGIPILGMEPDAQSSKQDLLRDIIAAADAETEAARVEEPV